MTIDIRFQPRTTWVTKPTSVATPPTQEKRSATKVRNASPTSARHRAVPGARPAVARTSTRATTTISATSPAAPMSPSAGDSLGSG